MVTMNFPKPANWQDFQTFVKDLLNEKYDGGFDIYGRNGQAQDGIDILGSNCNNIIGTQCKRLETELTLRLVKEEVDKTDKSNLKLTKYFFATTCPRNKNLQREIITLSSERKSRSLFEIEIWFWETLEDEINSSLKIQEKYYENIFSKVNHQYKEIHILDTINMAFSRPAFLTPFMLENNNNDFFQAIKDTQEFLNTGKLRNRYGEYIAGSFSYKKLSSSKDIQDIDNVCELLQQIRDFITRGMKEGSIKTCDNKTDCFCFKDGGRSERQLDEYRKILLTSLNKVFIHNKMKEIPIRF